MPAAGLMLMPPVSKVTPLPMNTTGFSSARPSGAPFHCITTMRGGCALPIDTPSSEPKPSASSSDWPNVSIFNPSSVSFSIRVANSGGLRMLAGSLTRSRVMNTPRAIACSAGQAASDAARSPASTLIDASLGLSSGFCFVR